MNRLLFTKSLGTFVLLLVISTVFLTGFKLAHAQFIATANNTIVDGVVTSSSANSVTIATDGTTPITYTINSHTIFAGQGGASDLSSGDAVRIIATGTTARVIRINDNVGGYGFSGPVVTTRAIVTSKGANSFTATINGVNVTFQTTSATRFVGGTFASLQAGDQITVTGSDTGSNFTARTVVIHK